jgi:HEAT repeat protein
MGSGAEHWARVEALESLGRSGDHSAVAELTEVLDGEKECWHTKTAAIHALVALGAAGAAPAILKTLARDRDPDVREAAVDALGAFRFARAARALERLIDHEPDSPLAACARRALDRIHHR